MFEIGLEFSNLFFQVEQNKEGVYEKVYYKTIFF
jgi:hypothetical protein